ncbi:MAG TPA: response regulator [Clostridia bacterium]
MKKALVVDDTKNIRTLLTTCLEVEGFSVKTSNDGKSALELLSNENFDLVFLDIKMPEVSGTEVLKRVREQGIKTPFVIITAFATVKNAIECTRMGAVAYLQKPFTSDKVRSVLAELNSYDNIQDDKGKDLKIDSDIEACILSGHLDEALGILKSALSKDPSNAEIYRLFGIVYEKKGEMKLADKFSKAFLLFNS